MIHRNHRRRPIGAPLLGARPGLVRVGVSSRETGALPLPRSEQFRPAHTPYRIAACWKPAEPLLHALV